MAELDLVKGHLQNMFKKILYSFSIYSVTSIICALLNLLILPILTSHLSEKDYGTTALFSTYVLILSPIIGLSSEGFFWIEFFKKEKQFPEQRRLYSTHFWLSISNTLLITVILAAIFPFRDETTFGPLFLFLLPLTGFMTIVSEETRNYFVNHKKPLSYLFYTVGFTVLDLGLSCYLVVSVFNGWEGRIIGWLITLFLQSLISIWFFGVRLRYLHFTFSTQDLLRLATFGFPLIFHQLGKFAVNQSDRIFISELISVSEAGIYTIGYQFGSMILLPVTAFSNFYTPFVYERLTAKTADAKTQIVKMCYLFIGLILVCFLMIALLSPFFFQLFIDEKFHKGLMYVNWVSLSYVFWGFYILVSSVIFYASKTFFLGWLSVFNIVLNGILNYLFICSFGAIGAVYATAISFFIIFVATFIYSNRIMPLPWFYFLEKKNITK